MVDPLSVGASAVTLIDTTSTCLTHLVKLIKCVRNAPAEIAALSNDLNDLRSFFDDVKDLCEDVGTEQTQKSRFLNAAYKPLEDAGKALGELEKVLKRSDSQTFSTRIRLEWILQRAKAKKIHETLRRIKSDLGAALLLSTKADGHQISIRISKIEARLEDLHSTAFTHIQPFPAALPNSSVQILQPQLENRSPSLAEAPNPESGCRSLPNTAIGDTDLDKSCGTAMIAPSGDTQIEDFNNNTLLPLLTTQDASTSMNKFSSNATMFFHLNRMRRCTVACGCACHSTRRYRSPPLLNKFLGALFLGYSGSPGIWPKCNVADCRNSDRRSIDAVYCFPWWFCQRALHISAILSPSFGPTVQIRFCRRVPWGEGRDSLLKFALTGNVDGARSLLWERKASLTDADPNHGRTALHYAVLRNKIDVCELLLGAGADPHLQDDHGTTPSQKAWEQILCKRGTVTEIEGLKRVFPGTEELETWEFSYIHKIVLEIYPGRLADELQNERYHSQVHAFDSMNRTALHWAAIRGDVEAVRCLLDAGSDVNCRDNFNNTPLTFAASTGCVPVLELLILHGADVHARILIGSQAIHNVSRHQRAVGPVQTLLRAGAALNSTNKFGHSPLSGAAIANRYEIGAFLLDKGADMHVRSLHGDTPLFETIFHNNHQFLQMLLERGANPNDINNAGSTILHAAALEADTHTVEILRASNIDWNLCSRRDRNGSTALEIARRRVSPPRGFLEEFERLVAALGAGE